MTPEALRPVLFKLAHRLITSAATPSYLSADRFYVNLLILKELELWDEATTLLSSDIGQAISNTSLSVDELRRDIWKLKGSVKEEGERAQARILEKESVCDLTSVFLAILTLITFIVTETGSSSSQYSMLRLQDLKAKQVQRKPKSTSRMWQNLNSSLLKSRTRMVCETVQLPSLC